MSNYSLQSYDTAEYLAPTSGLDRLAAAACHGALVFGLPFMLPFCIWLVTFVVPATHYVRNQAMQALLFHAFFLLVTTATGYVLLGTFLSGVVGLFIHPLLIAWPVAVLFCLAGGLVSLWCIVVMFMATLRALQGQPYRVPVVGNWVH